MMMSKQVFTVIYVSLRHAVGSGDDAVVFGKVLTVDSYWSYMISA